MSQMTPLPPAEIDQWLADHPEWSRDDGKLHRRFTFPDFVAAFAFMTAVAQEAEAGNHHPEWHNVYNRVSVWLTTHDAGGITGRDFALAAAMDRLATA